MHFRAFPPPASLAPWVSMFWRLTGEGASENFDTVLPDGSVELIFHLGDPFMQSAGTTPARQSRAFVVGDIRRPVSIRPAGRTDVIGVRFRPGRAYGCFRTPMAAIANGTTALEDLTPACAWDRVAESADSMAFVATELQRMSARADEDRALHACIDAIVKTNGAATVRCVAARVGLSVRQLERKFAKGVGIPAKTFARVVRFHAVAERLRTQSVTAAAGYSDQPHLIREFREFSGMTPGDFLPRPGSLTEIFLG